MIGGENRTDTNIMINTFNPLLAKSGAEGVLFVTDNKTSYLFKCLDLLRFGFETQKPECCITERFLGFWVSTLEKT